jgi:heptosyltransferase II
VASLIEQAQTSFSNARILVRGLNWLGDAVMSTPALLRLRQAFPCASITLLTPAKLADLWQDHCALDSVVTFNPRESMLAISRRLRSGHYDAGLVLPNSFRSALEIWLARIPERIGYSGQGRDWLLTRSIAPVASATRMRKRSVREIRALTKAGSVSAGNSQADVPTKSSSSHHLHHYLQLTAELGADAAPLAPRLFVTESEVEAFLKKLELPPNCSRPLLGLNPGAEYGPAKRWPAEKFVAAACQIQEFAKGRWLIFGGASDRELGSQIAAGIERSSGPCAINVAGATSLRELCAGLRACTLLLTNDTGPMHVAAAVGTPVIVPFGSTSPELTGPGLPGDQQHRLIVSSAACAPCFLRACPIDFRCMEGITVEQVVKAAASKLLGQL